MSFRSIPCTFLGYSNQYKGYKCLSSDGCLFVSRHVTFDEFTFPFCKSTSTNFVSSQSITQTLPILSSLLASFSHESSTDVTSSSPAPNPTDLSPPSTDQPCAPFSDTALPEVSQSSEPSTNNQPPVVHDHPMIT